MNDTTPLYNSRIIKIFLDYLGKYYPKLDIDSLLQSSGMTLYEVEDQAHWFGQDQVDRFYATAANLTRNPRIAREAGQYTTSTEAIGALKQYSLGLMNITSLYRMMGILARQINKGVEIKTTKLTSRKVEITSILKAGVAEKPYQCENRMGMFESAPKLFTNQLAHIEHPECFHKGDKWCRYIISWENPPFVLWKQICKYAVIGSAFLSGALAFFFPLQAVKIPLFSSALLCIGLIFFADHLEKRYLTKTIQMQGDAAKEHMEEINSRYNNALLVQEIGQATSTILNPRSLIKAVGEIMEKRLDFDRGAIWLASKDRTRLAFQYGYGYAQEHESLLRKTRFHLDRPDSKGPFVSSFRNQKPERVSDITKNVGELSGRSLFLVKELNVQSLLCVPIVYEKESLGLITVDNLHSKRPLTQTDVSLLIGVASQTAMSLVNARSFQKMQDSERKYRELVESANSIILRVDHEGDIRYFNEFAQRFFGMGLFRPCSCTL